MSMIKDIIKATPMGGHRIELVFENGDMRLFDATPYIDSGVMRELKSEAYFRLVKIIDGTVVWPNGQDFCPGMLYEAGIPVYP